MIKSIIFAAILFVFTLQSYAQDSSLWTPPEKDSLLVILDHAYNLEFDSFEKKVDAYQKKYPDRPEALFVDVVALWIKVTTDLHNPKYNETFDEALDNISDKLDDFDDDHPLYEVAQFYVNATAGFKAIMHVARKNWFSAALEGRVAVRGIEDALEGKIPNPDAKFGTGLYLYYADLIPNRYPILKPLFIFYPDGDKKRGLTDLQETIDTGIFARVVAAYMNSVILFTREKKYAKAFKIMKELSDTYPQNPIFLMWQISIATRMRKHSLALDLLDIYTERTQSSKPFYPEHKMRIVNFRYGVIYYQAAKYEKALTYLSEAQKPLEQPMESYLERYKVYSILQSGYCFKNLGRLEKAKSMFELILTMKEYRRSHDVALDYLKRLEKLSNKKTGS
ncbi:MAG: hypothetical protein D8M58_08415 [Calditrichaeota bacterium]|nr:MAG: hypothetical protein DWQ03_18075 [Calditrichota bacterium]MBL1205405.1 hypothetical protein [Calditrichota bacterium]NOG45234.1 hypothetical protein [Calditrichota bacterium]